MIGNSISYFIGGNFDGYSRFAWGILSWKAAPGRNLLRPGAMKSAKRALLRFFVLAAAALALQGIPLIYMLMEGDTGVALYFLHLYAVIPLCAFFIPFWAGRGGVHPFAAFFPVGGALLLLPVYASPGMGLICMLLSLVGAVAGQEWERRKSGKKGKKHGKK